MGTPDIEELSDRDIEHVDDDANTDWYCLIDNCDMFAPERRQVARHAVRDHSFDDLLSAVIEERDPSSD